MISFYDSNFLVLTSTIIIGSTVIKEVNFSITMYKGNKNKNSKTSYQFDDLRTRGENQHGGSNISTFSSRLNSDQQGPKTKI